MPSTKVTVLPSTNGQRIRNQFGAAVKSGTPNEKFDAAVEMAPLLLEDVNSSLKKVADINNSPALKVARDAMALEKENKSIDGINARMKDTYIKGGSKGVLIPIKNK